MTLRAGVYDASRPPVESRNPEAFMQANRQGFVTVTLTEQEARNLAYTISEAIFGLRLPVFDGGYPFNWRGDPRELIQLHNAIKPDDWGVLE